MAIKYKRHEEFQPGRGYSKEDWDAVSDNPPITEAEMKSARPFKEAFPEMAREMEKAVAARGRPKADVTKTPVTIRLDPDLVEHYKATGRGWQSRMNDDLRKIAGI